VPALVPDDEVVAANSATWTAAVVSQVALAPLAGVLITVAGPGWTFGADAVTFVVSAAVLRRLHVGEGATKEIGHRRFLAEAREGVALVAEHLQAPSSSYGLMVAAIGVGAALGPTLLLRLVPDPRRPRYVFAPFVLRDAVDLVLATTRSLPVALGALAVYGIGTSTGAVTLNSPLQSHVTDRTRGRVFALMDLLWQAGRLASLGAGGLLADAVGVRAVYYLGGIMLLLAGTAGPLVTDRRSG